MTNQGPEVLGFTPDIEPTANEGGRRENSSTQQSLNVLQQSALDSAMNTLWGARVDRLNMRSGTGRAIAGILRIPAALSETDLLSITTDSVPMTTGGPPDGWRSITLGGGRFSLRFESVRAGPWARMPEGQSLQPTPSAGASAVTSSNPGPSPFDTPPPRPVDPGPLDR